MKRNQEKDYLFKIVITGDAASGKSKILQRFLSNTFDKPTAPTIGVEFVTKHVTLPPTP